MGGHNENVWWNTYYRGLYSYGLSPFYQKAVSGHIGHEFVQFQRGVVRQLKILGPFVLAGGLVVYYGKKTYRDQHRKAPVNIADSHSVKELTHSFQK